MEFESTNKASGSPEITDEQRQDASLRHVTLEPLHADLAPDDLPDEYIANQHILEPPIANVDIDTESTTPSTTTRPAVPKHHVATVVIFLIVLFVVACSAYMILFRT